jgi:hypothetical protein
MAGTKAGTKDRGAGFDSLPGQCIYPLFCLRWKWKPLTRAR